MQKATYVIQIGSKQYSCEYFVGTIPQLNQEDTYILNLLGTTFVPFKVLEKPADLRTNISYTVYWKLQYPAELTVQDAIATIILSGSLFKEFK